MKKILIIIGIIVASVVFASQIKATLPQNIIDDQNSDIECTVNKNGDSIAAIATTTTTKVRYKKKDAPCVLPRDDWKEKSVLSGIVESAKAALSLNGSSDKVDFGDNFDFAQTAPTTWEMWVKPNSSGVCSGIMDKIEPSGSYRGYRLFEFDCVSAGGLAFVIGQEDAGGQRIYCSANGIGFDDGVWKHVAVVLDGTGTTCSALKIYVNGISRTLTQYDTGSGASQSSTANLKLGVSYNSIWFNGSFDEFRIWNYARTADQINSGMWLRQTGEEGLKGYWRLDEMVDKTVYSFVTTVTGAITGASWIDSSPINYRQ